MTSSSEKVGTLPKSLPELQKEIGAWAREQFGNNVCHDNTNPGFGFPMGSVLPLLGLVGELGELVQATLKRAQWRDHKHLGDYQAAREDAVADMMVFLCDYASREGMDLLTVLNRVWERVSRRRVPSWEDDKKLEVGSGPDSIGTDALEGE